MPSYDDSFNARGPTVVAFETVNNNNQAVGVGATGTQCGVYGESSGSPLGTRPAKSDVPDGTGVHGKGDHIGVAGFGGRDGVYGQGEIGVSGQGEMGVSGLATKDGVRVGVNGRTDHLQGQKYNRDEAAVAGEAAGTSRSGCGIGIRGWSEFNRAGVFYTGPNPDREGEDMRPPDLSAGLGAVVAQIHLVPIDASAPPGNGRAGDFIVITGQQKRGMVELWFCQRSSSRSSGKTITAMWTRLA